jgi:hypothetical protein
MIADALTKGIRAIELLVVHNVRELGGTINGSSFFWNFGAAADRPPEIVSAQITTNTHRACLVLPREYCENYASANSRAEVGAAILDCVGLLTT